MFIATLFIYLLLYIVVSIYTTQKKLRVKGIVLIIFVSMRLYSHTVRGHFSIGTIGPRESVLCSQLSSDVVRVQSL